MLGKGKGGYKRLDGGGCPSFEPQCLFDDALSALQNSSPQNGLAARVLFQSRHCKDLKGWCTGVHC